MSVRLVHHGGKQCGADFSHQVNLSLLEEAEEVQVLLALVGNKVKSKPKPKEVRTHYFVLNLTSYHQVEEVLLWNKVKQVKF